MRKPGLRGLVSSVAVVAALLIAALAPSGASATKLTLENLGPLEWHILLNDPLHHVNHVGVTTTTPTGGSPDLVIGDLADGIDDPVPFPCQRVDAMIVRCPLNMITGFTADLGGGNDTFGIGVTQDIDTAALQIYTAYLGAGNDVAKGGPVINQFYGGSGRDELKGGPKADFLYGGAQNDFSVGLGGNDLFECGKGRHDRFNDGPGKDKVNVGTCEFRVHTIF